MELKYIYMFLLYINIWQIVVRRNNIKLHVGHSCYGPLPIPVQKNRISFRGFIICIKFDRGGNPCLRRFKLHCIDYNWRHCSNIKILAHEKKKYTCVENHGSPIQCIVMTNVYIQTYHKSVNTLENLWRNINRH